MSEVKASDDASSGKINPTEQHVARTIIPLDTTGRGFTIGRFKDIYGADCSIQKSSLAEIDALWLGSETGRMHITQEMAAALIPLLQAFVETGELQHSDRVKDGNTTFPMTSESEEGGHINPSSSTEKDMVERAIKEHRETCIVQSVMAGMPAHSGEEVRAALDEADAKLLGVFLSRLSSLEGENERLNDQLNLQGSLISTQERHVAELKAKAASLEGERDRLPKGHVVLEQADNLEGTVSQTVRRPDGTEYERRVDALEAYGEQE